MAKVKKISGPLVRTVKVKLLKGVVLGPGEKGRAGEIYEIPKHLATQLIFSGQAKETDEGDPLEHDEASEGEKDTFRTATVEAPTARDPKPARRG